MQKEGFPYKDQFLILLKNKCSNSIFLLVICFSYSLFWQVSANTKEVETKWKDMHTTLKNINKDMEVIEHEVDAKWKKINTT